jgi:hypothetical protein
VSVELGAACRPEARRCIPLFRERQDEGLERRARGMAWALSGAAVLRAPGRAAELRGVLLEAAAMPDSTIALVFSGSAGALDATQVAALQHASARSLRYVGPDSKERFWLEALADPAAEWRLPIRLDADELLVVPRLGALARVTEFVAEVRSAGDAEWVVVPTQG